MGILPILMLGTGALATLLLGALAFSGPSSERSRNRRLLAEAGVSVPLALGNQAAALAAQAQTVLYVAVAGQAAALFGVADTLRETSAAAVSECSSVDSSHTTFIAAPDRTYDGRTRTG